MNIKKLKIGSLFLLCIGITGLQAQQAITSSGGTVSGAGGTASYSMGQLVYTYTSASTGNVSQGVQQSYEISVSNTTSIDDAKDISLECVAYPNPTTDVLNLKVEANHLKDLTYVLFEIGGKIVETKKVTNTETSIQMNTLVAGTYFLKIISQNIVIKTFKIIKK